MIDKTELGDATLITADVIDGLQSLPADSVHCVVTSPPYYGLRNYNVEGMIGLEPTFQEWLDRMVGVFREVRRVLRPDGTFWLNCGDAYSQASTHGGKNKQGPLDSKASLKAHKGENRSYTDGLKPKDLLLMPARLAIALQADGWWLRSEIIWAKSNPMPESVTDRPTSAHEKIYLLTRSAKYFYDCDAVREPHLEPWRSGSHESDNPHSGRLDGGEQAAFTVAERNYNPAGRNLRNVWNISTAPYKDAHFATFPPALPMKCIMAGTSERGCCPECGAPWERIVEKSKRYDHVTTAAGKSKNGPYAAQTGNGIGTHDIRHGVYSESKTLGWKPTCSCRKDFDSSMGGSGTSFKGHSGNFKADGTPIAPPRKTTGWKSTCDCMLDPIPCTVLDCFSGSATTGLVALKLGRRYIGIELNPEYQKLALKRIEQEAAQVKMF